MSKNIYKISIFLASAGLILTFVIIPLVIDICGFSQQIYQGEPNFRIITYNFLCILLFYYLGIKLEFVGPRIKLKYTFKINLIYYSSFLLVIWLILFLVTGGLMYRENDVTLGYAGRSPILRFILSLMHVIIIITLSIITRIRKAGIMGKWIGFISVIGFLIVMALAGSRGIMIQLILSGILFMILDKKATYITRKWWRIIFTLKNTIAFAVLILAFGLLGLYRDNQSNFTFQLLYRLSEPYWNMALRHTKDFGGDISVLWDSASRIMQIPLQYVGHTIEGSIEGSDYYLENYINIPFIEGVSLPITLFGFGFLVNLYLGVPLVLILVFVFIRFALFINLIFSGNIMWGKEFLVTFATSCLLIYAKSFSGVVQILLYEKLTSFLVLFFLTIPWLIINRK